MGPGARRELAEQRTAPTGPPRPPRWALTRPADTLTPPDVSFETILHLRKIRKHSLASPRSTSYATMVTPITMRKYIGTVPLFKLRLFIWILLVRGLNV